tara:strand:- start:1826 stop:2449 length:624 start_codon:yes stop_codon:yes gene_type:complete
MNYIQISREISKEKDEVNPWVQAHMSSCNFAWDFILNKKLIQSSALEKWVIDLNIKLVTPTCNNDSSHLKSAGEYRKKDENSKVPHGEVQEKVRSIFLEMERLDEEHDDKIMPHRVKFEVASILARAAWKCHFQIMYIAPFSQGNAAVSRILANMLRCHWSLPWLSFNYEHEEEFSKEDPGRIYFNERDRWFALFDREGVLTGQIIE